MKYNIKLLLLTSLIFINTMLMGCSDSRKANPPHNLDNGNQSPGEKAPQGNIAEKVLLDAPIISQKPELKSGCEVTSLAMMLQYAGVQVDKMALAMEIKKDETPLVIDKEGNIKEWGDPNYGFVGDITGENKGFGVYPEPIITLMEKYMPGRAVNLSNQPFESLLKSIEEKRPVIVWVTIDFESPKKLEEWDKDGSKIKATLDEHAVLLVGYNKDYCYINDPLSGEKDKKINRDTFTTIWSIMGSMAVSYK